MTIMGFGAGRGMGDDRTGTFNRAQARHAMLVDAYRHAIADSTVMLVGAEDGAWCYALAAAGALQVVGIETDANLVERFGRLPDIGLRERIDLRRADPMEEIRSEVAVGRQYDVIILFDVLQGITDLHDLFGLIRDLEPRLVVVDGCFVVSEDPILWIERTRDALAGRVRPALIPGQGAVAMVAYDCGFDLDWIDWAVLDPEVRQGLDDYYAPGPKLRASFTLTPEQTA
ncbi:class I SAM-dependent methyltransferase [Roseovarius sp.]|uniref:class I SAM-dependent methyltransferase n=1 Tax=Roseovarius sp. TaxID=1486281 RepID=UPI003A98441D